MDNWQLPLNRRGGDAKCVFIDTKCTFRPERLVQTAEKHQMVSKIVTDHVQVMQTWNISQLFNSDQINDTHVG